MISNRNENWKINDCIHEYVVSSSVFIHSFSFPHIFQVSKETISSFFKLLFVYQHHHPKKDGKLAVFAIVLVTNDVTVVGKTFVLVTVRNLVENAL